MKKILIPVAALAAMMAVSCGNSQKQSESADGVAEMVEVEEIVDVANPTEAGADAATSTESNATALIDNIKQSATKENVQKALDYVKELIAQGKLEAAKTYLEQVKPYAEKVGMSKAVTTVESAIEKAKDMVGNVDKEALKDKVSDKAAELTDQAKAAAEKGMDKTKDAAQKGADALKGMLNN